MRYGEHTHVRRGHILLFSPFPQTHQRLQLRAFWQCLTPDGWTLSKQLPCFLFQKQEWILHGCDTCGFVDFPRGKKMKTCGDTKSTTSNLAHNEPSRVFGSLFEARTDILFASTTHPTKEMKRTKNIYMLVTKHHVHFTNADFNQFFSYTVVLFAFLLGARPDWFRLLHTYCMQGSQWPPEPVEPV